MKRVFGVSVLGVSFLAPGGEFHEAVPSSGLFPTRPTVLALQRGSVAGEHTRRRNTEDTVADGTGWGREVGRRRGCKVGSSFALNGNGVGEGPGFCSVQ